MSFIACLALGVVVGVPEASLAGQAPAESFKEFVARPPVIEDLIWTTEWPGVNTNYHRARYQSNALFYGMSQRPFERELSYQAFSLAMSRYEDTFWEKKFTHFFTWTNHYAPAERSNTVEFGHVLAAQQLAWPLNMGCHLADPATICWTGDSFKVTNQWRRLWLVGTLTRDERQRAGKLVVEARQLKGRKGSPDQVLICDYSYDRHLSADYLPCETWLTTQTPGQSPTKFCMRILEIETGQLPMAESKFSFLAAQRPAHQAVLVVSNEFLVHSDGKRVVISPDPRKADLREKRWAARVRRIYLTLALAAVGLGPLAYWLGRKWVPRGAPAGPAIGQTRNK